MEWIALSLCISVLKCRCMSSELLHLMDLMLLVPTCVQIFLNPTQRLGSISSIRYVATL